MVEKIQNFQLDSVRFLTYSWNISFIWSARWRVTGTPVAGSWAWHWLIWTFRDSISCLRISASFCICFLSAFNFLQYSAVFCSIAALLTLAFGFWLKDGIRVWRRSKPLLMLQRLFCSAEVWFNLLCSPPRNSDSESPDWFPEGLVTDTHSDGLVGLDRTVLGLVGG